jgi:hypothetical protein
MRRREFLGLAAATGCALAQQQQKDVEDSTSATATQDTTPRVGIVLSSLREAEEHDGAKLKGLDDPKPTDAPLTAAQVDGMVRKTIEMAATRAGDITTVIEAEDWVVIKTHIPSCFGLGPETKDGGAHQPYLPGAVTDLRVVRSLLSFLAEKKHGLRFTIVEGSGEWLPAERSGSPVDGWNSEWDGAFDGLSYRKMVAELGRKFPHARFEILDLNFSPAIELPVPGQALAGNNPGKAYTVARVMRQADKVISVAPLKTDAASGVALTAANSFGIAPGSKYGFPKDALFKLGTRDEIAVDLMSYHPPDFATLGGCLGVEGGGADASTVRHNLLVAGTKPVCVDLIAAVCMGFKPDELPYLAMGDHKGFGLSDEYGIWTRGNDTEQALKAFRKAPGWRPPQVKK